MLKMVGEYIKIKLQGINLLVIGNKTRKMDLVNKKL